MRRLAALLASLATVALSALAADSHLDAIRCLPESNPYRSALERYTALPDDARERLEAWVSPLDDGAKPVVLTQAEQTLAHELSTALVTAAKAPPLTEQDWPITPDPDAPDNFFAARLPPVGPMRQLSRLSVKVADALPAAQALEIYAAVAQFGRNQRAGSTLIQQLTGVAIEGIALKGPTRRLDEFTPDQLRRLSETWAGLHPRPSLEQSLAGERDQFFHPFIEKVLLPGLHALIAEAHDAADSDAGPFTHDLRLSGLMDLGGGERRIALENVAAHTHFTLEVGQTVDGIELVSMDIEKRQAVIRRGKREAVIDLESKRIAERKLSSAQISEYLKGLSMFSDEDEQTLQARWLKRINEHPKGLDGYLDDLRQEYHRQLDLQITRASTPTVNATESPISDDPLMNITMPSIGKVARSLNSSVTQGAMLQAAIHHRLGQLGTADDAAPPVDPWSDDGAPFAISAAPGGAGFVITSRYEVNSGQPVTYKFAAPDAGFIRVSPKP
jgi:hypothetical protein